MSEDVFLKHLYDNHFPVDTINVYRNLSDKNQRYVRNMCNNVFQNTGSITDADIAYIIHDMSEVEEENKLNEDNEATSCDTVTSPQIDKLIKVIEEQNKILSQFCNSYELVHNINI